MKKQRTILLVSDDPQFSREVRLQLSACLDRTRVTIVDSLDAAWHAIEQSVPELTLLPVAAEGTPGGLELQPVVQSLANYAPVIVLGPPECQAEISALVRAGAADYVAREEGPAAVVRAVQRRVSAEAAVKLPPPRRTSNRDEEDFGEVLRHELNNPLTGILGNAELLLSEIRRKSDGKLPHGGQQRVETIAALAVRLRETIRRLSQEWDSQRGASAAMRHG
jgi:signal transduction histidine kinase